MSNKDGYETKMVTFHAGSGKVEGGDTQGRHSDTGIGRLLPPLLLACVLATPILIPPISANAVPGDIVNVAFIVLAAGILWRTRGSLRIPFGFSYLLFLLGGIVALPQSIDPSTSALTLVEDAYLFVWFLLATNSMAQGLAATPSVFCRVWVLVGLVVALLAWLALLGYPDHVPLIWGWRPIDVHGRAVATLRDPNLAGNYLVVSLFVLWAAPRPTKPLAKALLSVPFVLGLGATYSNTALISLLGGSIAALAVGFLGRNRLRMAIALALATGTLLLLIGLDPPVARWPSQITSSVGRTAILNRSIGRVDDSAADRQQRWQQALYLFGGQVVWGIGPASTTQALASLNAPISGELHSDYVAAFVERGILGGLGATTLFVVATIHGINIAFNRKLRSQGWRPPALVGGTVAISLSAVALEVLHFRHVWLFFALLMALRLQAGSTASPGPR
jgi:hypothetical protein